MKEFQGEILGGTISVYALI